MKVSIVNFNLRKKFNKLNLKKCSFVVVEFMVCSIKENY